MNNKYLEKLEYNKVLEMLSLFSKTYIGINKCKNLMPSDNVEYLLNQTYQAYNLICRNGSLPISEIDNIDILIKNLDSNFSLDASDLLKLAHILKTSRELKEYFCFNEEEYNLIANYFSNLYINKNLEKEIADKILDENTISDNASAKLKSIRKAEKNLCLEIKNKLNTIVHSSTYSKYLQDSVVTIKNERYVVPVKEEYRGQIKGFVHDVSSSGSTVFIEPISVFELNNELNNLKADEQIEILRILEELSRKFALITIELKNNVSLIGELDFIFAKASFSKSINGIKPEINNKKYVNLVSVRHPLIDRNKVVPIDISIGDKYSSLIITGPNTGGKTVALKTTGLILLMAYSGILIPANENSSIFVFDNIFVDIGDEQSISESLSTFSSHILNIIEITKCATKNSLILLDELGSGTDPIEGSRLAISILEHFHNLGATTISTTHYQELKEYALSNSGFENASFEFDIDTLSPTYKLLIGIPGKSNAFAISKKLGLDNNILERAKSLVEKNDVNIEDLLKGIYDNKLEIEKQKEETTKNLNQVELLRKKLERDYSDLEEKANKTLIDAKAEARDILLDAQENADKIIKEMNAISKNKSKESIQELYDLKNEINVKIKNVTYENSSNEKGNLNLEDIKIGMNVFVIPLNKDGIVTSLPNDSHDVEIQIGSLKTSVNIDKLMKSNNKTNNIPKNVAISKSKDNNASLNKSKTISPEINVIGLNVEEANQIIDKYLDDANLSKLETVRIVHGKGTGKLRQGIHSFLKTHPHVKSFRIGTYGEGEMGVTVVTLR